MGQPIRVNTNKKILGFLIFYCSILALAVFISFKLYEIARESSLWEIKKIQINGIKRLREEEVLRIMAIGEKVSLWDLKLQDLEDKLSQHPWIEKAFVKWSFFGMLDVTIIEKTPFLILCCHESCFYSDIKGILFSSVDLTVTGKNEFPVFYFCPEKNLSISSDPVVDREILTSFTDLFRTVRRLLDLESKEAKNVEITYTFGDGFALKIGKIRVIIGMDGFESKISRLRYVLKYMEEAGKMSYVKVVDLRYKRWGVVLE